MIDSRAWASAPSPSVHTPSSSGPRCRSVQIIAHSRASISARPSAGCGNMKPAMPHIPNAAAWPRSCLDHMFAGKTAAGAGIAGIDDERAVLDEQPVIDGIVVGADDRGIYRCGGRLAQRDGAAAGELRVVAGARDLGQMRVVEHDLRPVPLERLHDGQRRTFPRVVDVLLVGDADNEDPRARE